MKRVPSWRGLLAALGLWELLVRRAAGDNPLLASFGPGPAPRALLTLLQTPDIWLHLGLSLKRIAVGLLAGVLIGLPLGLAVRLSPAFARASTPLFQFLRMISPLSWMPLAVMAFGVGDGRSTSCSALPPSGPCCSIPRPAWRRWTRSGCSWPAA